MLAANIFNIPNFLKAKTEAKLMKLMLKTNVEDGAENKYFDIQYVKGYWFAWYYTSVKKQTGAK